MKRVKWKRWLAIAGISAVLVGGAGIWAMNHAADFILKSLGEQPVERPSTASVKEQESSNGQLEQTNNSKGESERKEEGLAESTPQKEPDQATAPPPVQPGVSAGPAAPSPGSGNNGKKEGFAYSAEISSDKAEQVQEEVTAQEKAFVMTTILKKFSPEEMNLFMRLASGGLSLEEKKEAKKIFLRKLTEEEYNRLIAIASKYGLSQGKSYRDSLKEK